MKILNLNNTEARETEKESRNRGVNYYSPADRNAEKKVDNSNLPVALIAEIYTLLLDKAKSESIFEGKLPRSYRMIITSLAARDGKTQLDLAKETKLKAPTISVTLQKMERDGLVTRNSDENDMRAMRVYLTDAGRAANDFLWEKVREYEESLLSGFDDYEINMLKSLLRRLRDNAVKDDKFTADNT